MSDFRSKYREFNNAMGSSIRDSQINSMKSKISDLFYDSPSYFQVTINSSSTLSDVWIVDDSKTKELKQIQMKPDDILSAGDIVNWKSNDWLVTIVDDLDVYYRGSIQRCNSTLKWQSNATIYSTPCVISNNSIAGDGVNTDKYMMLPVGNLQVTLPNNVDTKTIEIGRRFIVDGAVWIVEFIDRVTMQGLILLNVKKDELKDTDDLVLGVADYVETIYTLSIVNGDKFSIRAGTNLQLDTEVKLNGVVVDSNIIYSSSNTAVATVDANGLVKSIANGTVVITAKLAEDETIQDTASITVQLSTVDNLSVTFDASPINVNYSKTFTRTVTKNGVVDNNKLVQWYLYADDGESQSDIAQLTWSSTTQCTIKGLKVGYVKLKCVVIGYPTVYTIQRVQIKSLI